LGFKIKNQEGGGGRRRKGKFWEVVLEKEKSRIKTKQNQKKNKIHGMGSPKKKKAGREVGLTTKKGGTGGGESMVKRQLGPD